MSSTVKLYTNSATGRWKDGRKRHALHIDFEVPSQTSQVMAQLSAFDVYFPEEDHHMNHFSVEIVQPDAGRVGHMGTKKVTVTVWVMLRDKNGDDTFDATISVCLIAVM